MSTTGTDLLKGLNAMLTSKQQDLDREVDRQDKFLTLKLQLDEAEKGRAHEIEKIKLNQENTIATLIEEAFQKKNIITHDKGIVDQTTQAGIDSQEKITGMKITSQESEGEKDRNLKSIMLDTEIDSRERMKRLEAEIQLKGLDIEESLGLKKLDLGWESLNQEEKLLHIGNAHEKVMLERETDANIKINEALHANKLEQIDGAQDAETIALVQEKAYNLYPDLMGLEWEDASKEFIFREKYKRKGAGHALKYILPDAKYTDVDPEHLTFNDISAMDNYLRENIINENTLSDDNKKILIDRGLMSPGENWGEVKDEIGDRWQNIAAGMLGSDVYKTSEEFQEYTENLLDNQKSATDNMLANPIYKEATAVWKAAPTRMTSHFYKLNDDGESELRFPGLDDSEKYPNFAIVLSETMTFDDFIKGMNQWSVDKQYALLNNLRQEAKNYGEETGEKGFLRQVIPLINSLQHARKVVTDVNQDITNAVLTGDPYLESSKFDSPEKQLERNRIFLNQEGNAILKDLRDLISPDNVHLNDNQKAEYIENKYEDLKNMFPWLTIDKLEVMVNTKGYDFK